MKIQIKSNILQLTFACYLTSIMNLSFWRYVFQKVELLQWSDYLFIITVPFLLTTLIYLLLHVAIIPYLTKIILIPILLISSITNYAMFNLGIYIDSDLIRSILQTNQREAVDLITFSAFLWLILMGIIPALLLMFTKIIYPSFLKAILFKITSSIICLLIIAFIQLHSYKEYAAFGRNNPQLTRLINPTNYLYATGRYYQKILHAQKPFQILDPNPSYQANPAKTPRVFIFIAGETSRSMNFSLNGYSKLTNPKLAKQDVISFKNVTSCGTATAISIPCMFSHLPPQHYNADQAAYSENLLDILQKVGFNVLWRENDDGCKGVCKRIPTDNMVILNHPQYCDGSSCFDEVMIQDLESYLSKVNKDTFIVLHTIGSHGPTYYKRYPKEFKVFTPTCDSAEIQKCSREAITNTYDNTIVYADHIISSTIDIMKKFPQLDSGLLYISDHGESLGENNIYLHGFPYAIAPKEQTSVPMIFWQSELMRQTTGLDHNCLTSIAETDKLTQDNIFHSILGLLKIKTTLYQAKLDFFKDCLKSTI